MFKVNNKDTRTTPMASFEHQCQFSEMERLALQVILHHRPYELYLSIKNFQHFFSCNNLPRNLCSVYSAFGIFAIYI